MALFEISRFKKNRFTASGNGRGVMHNQQSAIRRFGNLAAASILALSLFGCSGDDGAPGAPGATGPGVAPLASSTALTFTITGVTIGSPPVVNFSVANQDGVAVAGFAQTDLRFNIAKLVPGSNGTPSKWQNYINRASSGAVQGSQERSRTGYSWGTLVDHLNGTFTYTFATDITNPAANPCPAPCTDADGGALNISYQSGLTHRVTIQQSNTVLPKANATYDFVPAGGAVTTRDIVKTSTCNECHNQLTAHGSRIETKLCVTCHNPGSWVAGATNTPVDFKVMIHKIHQGEELPSVKAGTPYMVGSADFSTVVFPYSAVRLGDTRACAKCHDGAVTAQGDNWKNVPSKAACSSCHDDLYFGNSPNPAKPYETVSHIIASGSTAPADPTDDMCSTCHGAGKVADVVVKHDLPNLLKAESTKYQFNIIAICGVAVGSSPICAPGVMPTVKFSVTNPVASTTYDILNDAAFKCVPGIGNGLPASVSMLIGWNNTDENNTGSGSDPAQPLSNSVLESYTSATGVCTANSKVAANGDGTFTLSFTGKTIPASGVAGSGRAALYGRIVKDVDGDTVRENVRIKAAYKDFRITDPTPVARRQVVDIAKCDKCHDQVSLHGDSRTNEPGLCVVCHNPNATDVTKRPKTVAGIPDPSLTLDNKKEEAIDFKRLIHGVHAAAKTDYTGAAANGFRNKGMVVWGYGNSQNDFSKVRFPGILNDCLTCHLAGTYELTGKWEVPTTSGVLGSTIDTAPSAVDAATLATGLATNVDDLNITPTAAVCSACHDSDVAKSHMTLNGALFAATQATINTGAVLEACAICHGPGRIADVKLIHGVK